MSLDWNPGDWRISKYIACNRISILCRGGFPQTIIEWFGASIEKFTSISSHDCLLFA